ncbi:DUF4393 domain-containing protein [Limosilactobacillus fermentum]
MDPNQIEAWKNFLPQSTIEYLVNPAARTTGQALDGVATALCWPLLKLKIIQKAKLEQFTKEIREKNKQIPVENRDSSKVGLAVKAIEEARYQLNEDDIRKLYVNLIASTVDNRKNGLVTPRLATALSQMGPNDAVLLKHINEQESHVVPFGYFIKKDNVGTSTISKKSIDFFKAGTLVNQDISLDVLDSLGIIEVKHDAWLTNELFKPSYDKLEESIRVEIHNIFNFNAEEIEFTKGYIKVTDFGEALLRCIFL